MSKKTVEEVRTEVLDHVRLMVKYWSELPGLSVADRCDGVAFSILTMIDGCAATPPLTLSVMADDDDDEGYTDGMAINADCHLHELLHQPGGV